jgi:hypothetical protein
MDKKGETINLRILLALHHINRMLGLPDNFPAHWVGLNGNQPPPTPGGMPTGRPIPPASGPQSTPGSGAQSQRSYSPEEHAMFNSLLVRTRNIETAIRLIEYERKLAPNASEVELIRRAIEHWEKDNR